MLLYKRIGRHSTHLSRWLIEFRQVKKRLDPWASYQSFSSLFPRIFDLPLKKSEVVSEVFLSSSWNLHFRRYIRGTEIDELSSLLSIISALSPSPSGSDTSL